MAKPKIILFADDDAWFVQSLIDELREIGYVVFQARTGTETLKILSKEPVDLLILDIMMPPGDSISNSSQGRRTGIEVVKLLRKGGKNNIPIIYLTVISDPTVHNIIASLEKDPGKVTRILVKPVSATELVEEVQDCLGES